MEVLPETLDKIHPNNKVLKEWLIRQLMIAYVEARRGKRWTFDAQKFEVNVYENILLLAEDIMARTYKPSPGIAFVVEDPVLREIFAAPFRDRVVHHFLFNMVYWWWDRRFIRNSYSCRREKGVLFGIQTVEKQLRSVTESYKKEAMVLKFDIKGYFMSLKREMLYREICWGLERQFPDNGPVARTIRYLWKEIIMDDPTKHVKKRGNLKLWKKLPTSKSLFNQPPGQGIVIGNLTSQLLSNVHLDELDWFVTREMGFKYYGRYVDDFYLLVQEKDFDRALSEIPKIEAKVEKLGLHLHDKKRYIQNVKKGVPFTGGLILPGRTLMSDRTVERMRKVMYGVATGQLSVERLMPYIGLSKHFNSDKLKERLFDELGWDYVFENWKSR